VSPDRKVVAFSRNGQVWLVEFDGKGERQITSQTPSQGSVRTVSSLAWSPGGASLLFLAFNTAASRLTLEIWTCGVDAGSEHLLYSESVNTEYGVFYSACTYPPVYIAGGKRILFTSLAGGEPHVVTIASDGTDLREMAPAPSSFPALDPNESKLAYVDLSDFHERIRILDIASGKRSAPLFRK
jgi:Tol biopolymer transport system component